MGHNTPRIYSGLSVAAGTQDPHNWAGRALSRHLRWCREREIEYTFIASPCNRWARLAAYPGSWTFGTLIKFEAMRDFLENGKRGEVFIWMDLDVYPEKHARLEDMTDLGTNVLAAPLTPPSMCGWPGLDRNHLHMYTKLTWAGRRGWLNCYEYLALSSGMFSLNLPTLVGFWEWLNRDHSIDSPEWWEAYRQRQVRCAAEAAGAGECLEPFLFGSEEAILEDWLNEEPIEFAQFGFQIHGLCDAPGRRSFTHYYGNNKEKYPTD